MMLIITCQIPSRPSHGLLTEEEKQECYLSIPNRWFTGLGELGGQSGDDNVANQHAPGRNEEQRSTTELVG